jgi:hypothetical protein
MYTQRCAKKCIHSLTDGINCTGTENWIVPYCNLYSTCITCVIQFSTKIQQSLLSLKCVYIFLEDPVCVCVCVCVRKLKGELILQQVTNVQRGSKL